MLSRLFGLLACFFAAAALAGFAAATYLYFAPQDAPGAIVEEPDRDFPVLAVGDNEVRFRLHNPTGHPIRVVGCGVC